ncbi:MAG: SOS response-associated peptidase [Cytophagia bacterium]|nr:SOS response-associated peptidase [Cytophagia bacterium]
MSSQEKIDVEELYRKLTGSQLQKLIYGAEARFYFVDAYKDDHPEMPVITQDKPEEIQFFRWGVIPPFAKYIDKPNKSGEMQHLHPYDFGNYYSKTANAMVETLAEKSTWKRLYKKRRCVIPATGFYEFYHAKGKSKSYPHFISLKDFPLFGFAGLWDSWTDPDTGEVVNTFAIITTEPNEMMQVIHNNPKAHSGSRMPVMLIPDEWDTWLDGEMTIEEVQAMCQPFPTDGMQAWPVRQGLKDRGVDANIPKVQEKMSFPELGDDWRSYGNDPGKKAEQASLF